MTKKIVFIGNSIVYGFPFPSSWRFTTLVQKSTGHEVINSGQNGDTTDNILLRFEKDVISHGPDMVFILSGTNDFIYGEKTENTFRNLMHMAECALHNRITPVFLTPLTTDPEMASEMWIPGVDYTRINSQLEELAEMIRNSGKNFIDLTAAYKKCGKFCDGIHPLPEGHEFIADIIIKYLNGDNINL